MDLPDLLEKATSGAVRKQKGWSGPHPRDRPRLYPRLGLPIGVLTKYLHDLRYDLSPRDRAGLLTYFWLTLPDFAPSDLQCWHPDRDMTPLFEGIEPAEVVET